MQRLFCVLAGLGLLSTLCFAQRSTEQPQPTTQPPPPKIEVVTLTGTIATVEKVAAYEAVTFTLRDAAGVNTVVYTAPQVILDKFGLKLEEKADVTVTGQKYSNAETKTERVTAYTVKVNGKEVTFYDQKTGTRTYSLYESYYTLREFTGEITKVDTRDVVQPGGDAAKPQKWVTLYFTAKDSKKPDVRVKDPYLNLLETYLQQIQFTPTVGMKVTLSAWVSKQDEARMDDHISRLRPMIKSITVNGKTYPFRDDEGKGLWEPKPSPATPTTAR